MPETKWLHDAESSQMANLCLLLRATITQGISSVDHASKLLKHLYQQFKT